MDRHDEIKRFYTEQIPGATIEDNLLRAPCPFCSKDEAIKPGTLVVYLDPESFFMGYFRCLSRCVPGGFPLYFARITGVNPQKVPGFDPDREPYVRDTVLPTKNIDSEIKRFQTLMGDNQYEYFKRLGISATIVEQMGIGYNGRYLVFPYMLEDGHYHAARCMLPEREEDNLWRGEETFYSGDFRIYNMEEIERCEDGALFITDGEINLLTLKELGFPGIAVPTVNDLDILTQERLAYINHVFLFMNNSSEADLAARSLAIRLGFKARIIRWPYHLERGYNLSRLVQDKGKDFRAAVSSMLKASKAFSPFPSPDKEHLSFSQFLEREKGKSLLGLSTGFEKMDYALNGIRGINIMGGQPKAGKSCFFLQISAEMARKKVPVIYYDFENGRQKIYTRILCQMSRLSEQEIRLEHMDEDKSAKLKRANLELKEMLPHFRVVTDRKLSPDIMRRKIDFLQHETKTDYTLVVVDSLHKLPFKSLTERRSGIDEWLRYMEAIRDEQNVTFLVISELSRGEGGRYSDKPDLGSFKESGDIEYSADNAMILVPNWDPLEPISSRERKNTLWLVASRENSPGKIAEYIMEYPFWSFRES
jgi:KaiC/GvpD/RAD55 family RecA-like ATPase